MHYGFEWLSYALPRRTVPVEDLVAEAGMDPAEVDRLHSGGVHEVPVGEGAPLPVLVQQAVDDLAGHVRDLPSRIHAVLFAHSIPVFAPLELDFFAACLQGLRQIPPAPRMAVGGQPCAIVHRAIRLAMAHVEEAPEDHGVLLLTGDVAYNAASRLYFGAAMGDSALAGFLVRGNPTHTVLASVSQTRVYAWDGERSPQDAIAAFRRVNPLSIREAIESCLDAAGVNLQDVRVIVPHTPYVQIWDTVATLLRVDRKKILTKYISHTGHLNSNDSFVHYLRACQDGLLDRGDLALLVNPGFGGSRGCTLLEVNHG